MTADRRSLLNDNEESLRIALEGVQSAMWTALPGVVTSVDFAKMVCSVQPTLKGQITLENGSTQLVNLPVLINVPIVFPSAGGFTITLPLAADDEVLVVFSARAIDSWWQSGGIQKPVEARMHDLSDGFAIPGPKSQPNVISGISSTGAQIRNNAGTTYIEIAADGKIKLVSPSEVQITGDLKVTGDVIGNSATVPISLTLHTHTSTTPGNPTSPPLP